MAGLVWIFVRVVIRGGGDFRGEKGMNIGHMKVRGRLSDLASVAFFFLELLWSNISVELVLSVGYEIR